MTAKEYLEGIAASEFELTVMKHEIERLRAQIESVSSKRTDVDRVKTSLCGDKLASRVAKLVDMEREYLNNINLADMTREKKLSEIQGLSNVAYSKTLYYRYVKEMTFKQIGSKIGYSLRHVQTLHDKALKEFEEKYALDEYSTK